LSGIVAFKSHPPIHSTIHSALSTNKLIHSFIHSFIHYLSIIHRPIVFLFSHPGLTDRPTVVLLMAGASGKYIIIHFFHAFTPSTVILTAVPLAMKIIETAPQDVMRTTSLLNMKQNIGFGNYFSYYPSYTHLFSN
jgi:hypothetical protein